MGITLKLRNTMNTMDKNQFSFVQLSFSLHEAKLVFVIQGFIYNKWLLYKKIT